MHDDAKAYLYWNKNKSGLEKIVNNYDHISHELDKSNPEDNCFYVLQDKIKKLSNTINNIKQNCGEQLPREHYKLLKKAEIARNDLITKLQLKFEHYQSLERKITAEINKWHEAAKNQSSNKQQHNLITIMGLCCEYKSINNFDKELVPTLESSTNYFYVDFASLAFTTSNVLADEILNLYAAANTITELNSIKTKFDQDFWKKSQQERTCLREKYCHKISKIEMELINTMPLDKFTQIYLDMKKVMSEPKVYLEIKSKIAIEIDKIKSQIDQLGESKPELITVYISKLLLDVTIKEFQDKGSLYLQENIHRYRNKVKELIRLNEKVKKDVIEMIITGYDELYQNFQSKIDFNDILVLNNYESKFMELKNYCVRLREDKAAKHINDIIERIKIMKDYIISLESLTKSKDDTIIHASEYQLDTNTKEKEAKNTTLPLKEDAEKESINIVPTTPKKLDTTNHCNKTPKYELLLKPLNTLSDLVACAQYHDQMVNHPLLAELCRTIVGIDEKNKYSTTMFKDRVDEKYINKLKKNSSELTGTDLALCEHLIKGIEMLNHAI